MDIVDLYTKFMSIRRSELPSLDYFAGAKDFANYIRAQNEAAQHNVQSDGLKPCAECGALGYSHRPSCSKFGSYVVSTRR